MAHSLMLTERQVGLNFEIWLSSDSVDTQEINSVKSAITLNVSGKNMVPKSADEAQKGE